MNNFQLIKNINYVAVLIAMMVVLSQTMRIQIIPRTSIPLFLIPIFISGFILNWYWCFLIGIMGHFLSDLTLWGFTVGSLCLNIGTGLLAVLIKLINWIKINHSIKIILILLSNIIIYLPIDFVLFWLNIGVLNIEQIIIGILITNTICLPIFYFITLKIKKKIKNNFIEKGTIKMKETEKYISYQVMTNNLILTKPYYDIKGNKWIELRIKNLLYPYASININSKYFKLQYNKDYCFITIFKNQNFYIKNKDGKIKGEVNWEKLHPFLLEMDKQVLIKKAELKKIYQENLKYFNGNKFPKKDD